MILQAECTLGFLATLVHHLYTISEVVNKVCFYVYLWFSNGILCTKGYYLKCRKSFDEFCVWNFTWQAIMILENTLLSNILLISCSVTVRVQGANMYTVFREVSDIISVTQSCGTCCTSSVTYFLCKWIRKIKICSSYHFLVTIISLSNASAIVFCEKEHAHPSPRVPGIGSEWHKCEWGQIVQKWGHYDIVKKNGGIMTQ